MQEDIERKTARSIVGIQAMVDPKFSPKAKNIQIVEKGEEGKEEEERCR